MLNVQHVVNEVALYACMVLLLLCSGVLIGQPKSKYMSHAFIGIIVILLVYNTAIILIFTCGFLYRSLTRLYAKIIRRRRAKRLAKNKVMPIHGRESSLSMSSSF